LGQKFIKVPGKKKCLNIFQFYLNMAQIRFIDVKDHEILLHLSLSREEYSVLSQKTENLLLLPGDEFDEELTTGRLGNSNRIMLPKRVLEKVRLKMLEKKVPARIFRINGNVYLLIRLKEEKIGIPEFKV